MSGGSLTAAAGSPFAVGTSPAGVTVDPSGRFAYIANSGSASITKYSINTSTGVLSGASTTSLASGAAPYFLLARPAPFSAATVPTLSGWGLLLLAMLLAGSSAFLYKRAYR
jgi:6-phosphogluconolactonase